MLHLGLQLIIPCFFITKIAPFKITYIPGNEGNQPYMSSSQQNFPDQSGILLQKAEFPKDRISNLNLPSVILKGSSLVLKPQT